MDFQQFLQFATPYILAFVAAVFGWVAWELRSLRSKYDSSHDRFKSVHDRITETDKAQTEKTNSLERKLDSELRHFSQVFATKVEVSERTSDIKSEIEKQSTKIDKIFDLLMNFVSNAGDKK